MTNERKIFAFFGLILVAAGGLALVMQYRTKSFAPEVVRPQRIEESVGQAEEPKDVEIPKTFTSADHVTTVTVASWFEKENVFFVSDPTMITGTTTAFESQIAWKLTDVSGRMISEGSAHVASPDAGIPGPFQISLFYGVQPAVDRGTLHVFEASAKDGSPIHDVNIPVAFR